MHFQKFANNRITLANANIKWNSVCVCARAQYRANAKKKYCHYHNLSQVPNHDHIESRSFNSHACLQLIYSYIRLQIAQSHKLITMRLKQQRRTNKQLVDGKQILLHTTNRKKTCVNGLRSSVIRWTLSWTLKSTHHWIHYKLQHEKKLSSIANCSNDLTARTKFCMYLTFYIAI